MTEELDLRKELKAKCFQHSLRDYALQVYRKNIEKKANNYDEILTGMDSEFCSSFRAEKNARQLEALLITQFESKKNTEQSALKELARNIQALSPLAAMECRRDQHRKRILHVATHGRDWELKVSSSTSFVQLGYQ